MSWRFLKIVSPNDSIKLTVIGKWLNSCFCPFNEALVNKTIAEIIAISRDHAVLSVSKPY